MKRFLLLLITLVLSNTLTSQTIYKEINSEKLGESRQLKIQVPRNYDTSDKKYPVVVVFDGDDWWLPGWECPMEIKDYSGSFAIKEEDIKELLWEYPNPEDNS